MNLLLHCPRGIDASIVVSPGDLSGVHHGSEGARPATPISGKSAATHLRLHPGLDHRIVGDRATVQTIPVRSVADVAHALPIVQATSSTGHVHLPALHQAGRRNGRLHGFYRDEARSACAGRKQQHRYKNGEASLHRGIVRTTHPEVKETA